MKTNFKTLWGNSAGSKAKETVLVVLSLILFITVVHAQDSTSSFRKINISNQFEIAMVDNMELKSNSIIEPTNRTFALPDFLQILEEEYLEIETWMFKEEIFDAKSLQANTVKEDPLKLENWMINEQLWKAE